MLDRLVGSSAAATGWLEVVDGREQRGNEGGETGEFLASLRMLERFAGWKDAKMSDRGGLGVLEG